MTIATVARRHPLLQLAADAPRWDGAACINYDPELWFCDDQENAGAKANTLLAKLICIEECPIRDTCLKWALDTGQPFGVWGGMTTDERSGRDRAGRCQCCRTPIPNMHRAKYCDACRADATRRQNESRARKKGTGMNGRLTTADVEVTLSKPDLGQVSAKVRSRGRTYVVDLNPLWSDNWLCSCGHAPTCAHIRVTREAVGQ